MITEIPTAREFHATGVNQLYPAWQIAMQAVEDFERIREYAPDEEGDATTEYWSKSQPALANAFALIQQAMEMALKGRIAEVSPLLLIGRDPKDWPKGVEIREVPFSEFRSVDAADLIKVHNSFCSPPLSKAFQTFWEGVRRDRNQIMHSVRQRNFDPGTLVRTILTAAESLFADVRWTQRLLDMVDDGKYAAYGLNEDTQNVVMMQVDIAVRHLSPAEAKRFFSLIGNRRRYLCPVCYDRADRDWQEDFPFFAQLISRSAKEANLHCIVCDETSQVNRTACINPDCRGNVIFEGGCLICKWEQDSPQSYPSGLTDNSLSRKDEYSLEYSQRGRSAGDRQKFRTDADAVEHARLALAAPYLQDWQAVTVWHERALGVALRSPFRRDDRLIGSWIRKDTSLNWLPNKRVSSFSPDGPLTIDDGDSTTDEEWEDSGFS